MTRWFIFYDRAFHHWVAMPVDRPWKVVWDTNWAKQPVMGPIGTRWFPTWRHAMQYAHDPYQAYVDGWQA